MTKPHVHTWALVNAALRRYRCECGVIGHACRRGIVAYVCQHELTGPAHRGVGRKHCGADAVYVTAERTKSRCVDHAPPHSIAISELAADRLGPDPDATINRLLDDEIARN